MSVPWVFPGGPLVLGACEARVPGWTDRSSLGAKLGHESPAQPKSPMLECSGLPPVCPVLGWGVGSLLLRGSGPGHTESGALAGPPAPCHPLGGRRGQRVGFDVLPPTSGSRPWLTDLPI